MYTFFFISPSDSVCFAVRYLRLRCQLPYPSAGLLVYWNVCMYFLLCNIVDIYNLPFYSFSLCFYVLYPRNDAAGLLSAMEQ